LWRIHHGAGRPQYDGYQHACHGAICDHGAADRDIGANDRRDNRPDRYADAAGDSDTHGDAGAERYSISVPYPGAGRLRDRRQHQRA
jgi:hypothetical protein